MAIPTQPNSQTFERDQRLAFRAHYWPTTTTAVRVGPGVDVADRLEAFGSGLTFAMFDILQSGFSLNTTTPDTTLNDTALVRSVLGYDTGVYRTGVVPNVYAYWGAGAPPGGTRARQVLMKYSGYIHEDTDPVSLVFAGQGTVFVRVRHTGGSYTTLVSGVLREPSPSAQTAFVTPSVIRDEWGYQYTAARSFLAGEQVEIYYWHDGEAWGGLAAKVIYGSVTTNSDAFLRELRDAPVLGVSFMAKEAAPLAAQAIEYLMPSEIRQKVDQVAELRMRVGLTRAGDSAGYLWDETEHCLVDSETPSEQLRVGRAVHFEGGFIQPGGAEELYGRFTGYIDEIFPSDDGSHAIISCRGFDQKLAETFDENTPDRLDYHAAGFVLREPSSEPVFGIPAADHWPVTTLFMALMARAGIDHYNLGMHPTQQVSASDHGRFQFVDQFTGNAVFGSRLFSAQGFSDSTTPLQLDRNTNYGNVAPLVKDFLPPDDTYLFAPAVTQRLMDRVRQISEHFGYDFSFNAEGQCVFTGRNNPQYFQYATKVGTYSASASAADQEVDVNAVGGVYHGVKHSATPVWSRVVTGHFARLDMYVGVGANPDGENGGLISVLIERSNGVGGWTVVSDEDYSTFSNNPESFYYDGLLRADGTNAAVIPILALPFDHYRVTVASAGPDVASEPGAVDCWYRLNGFAVYERNPDQSYYMNGAVPHEFSTVGNALSLAAESNAQELRNHVVVVGGRRATITDSAKLAEEGQVSENNPEQEFHVAVAVDPFSIYDPTSENFVGMKRMTVVFDDRITDSGHARWLTRAILFRYKNPQTSARLSHSVVPTLELRDAIVAVEAAHSTVQHLVWVTSFTEKWSLDEALTEIDTAAYPEIPSYQPREDIDIDTLFIDPSDGKGEPAIDVQIAYRNIYGRSVGNSLLSRDTEIRGFHTRAPGEGRFTPMRSEEILSGVSHATTYPAIPETMYLGWGGKNYDATYRDFEAGGHVRYRRRALVNGPYRHFYNLTWNPTTKLPTLSFDFQEGDGTAGVYDQTYYGFPTTNLWHVHYDYLTARTIDAAPAENPFYDPYTSELGNLVDVSFALLVSGRVRVSVWAYSDTLGLEVPVAWLTAPTADPERPEAHWVYLDSGAQTFSFDGVDNIGLWNSLQSQDYAAALKGAFGDKPMAVGRGFYAWNDKATNLHTAIGDDNTWDNGDGRGARKINYDENGEPYYTIGQYSQFFVRIEVANDTLLRRDFSNGSTAPRVVDSRALPTALGMNAVSKTFIWQHLGEPTQVAIRMQDWARVDIGGALTETWIPGAVTEPADWTDYSTPDTDATFRVGKPVRITFQPRPHRGPMWEDAAGALDAATISAKLTRAVHHKGTVFDQFWYLSGSAWDDFHKDWVGNASGVEKKRLQNRMFHNEDHTIEYEDSAWRSGASLSAFEWVFDPSLFEKTFALELKEKLRYADYEQLEELPGFDARQLGGTAAAARAYLMLAYLSHLFYFSAFTIDRSGRRQHCINSWVDESANKRGWIDKTKIVTDTWRAATDAPAAGTYTPEYILDYERRGADRYLVRSMFTRQWKEPGWADGTYAGSPVSEHTITLDHHLAFVQPKSTDFDLYPVGTHPMHNAGVGLGDLWLNEYQRGTGVGGASIVNQMLRYRSSENDDDDTLPTLDTVANLSIIPSSFGTWSWDRPGLTGYFLPSPARDFHPYIRYPLTPDIAVDVNKFREAEAVGAPNVLEAPVSCLQYENRDFSAQEQWYGYAFSHQFALDYYTANPGLSVPRRYRHMGARVEQTVEELGAAGPNSRDDTKLMTRAKIEALFDYAKLDQLDRWEQFRGLRARAPFPDRNEWGGATHPLKRRSSVQPVKPSGTYLFSTARLGEISLAPSGSWGNGSGQALLSRCHWTDTVTDFWDLQFFHEYVWYNERYFPVSRGGGATYMFLRDEYTGASGWIGYPWEGGPPSEAVDPRSRYFDAGAWTGWRPDIVSGDNLKWKEANPISAPRLQTNALETLQGDPPSTSYITVPYNQWHSYSLTVQYRQVNIFDEFYSKATGPRLAVGFRLPEQRYIYMNLALPSRLRGD